MKRLRFFWVMALAGAVSCTMWGCSDDDEGVASNGNDVAAISKNMVHVKGGTFMMGASDDDEDAYGNEKPAHSVKLSDFYISKYEVTQAQWVEVMGSNPSFFSGDSLPVDRVTWDKVQEFITKLNEMTGKEYRLPTEAEWEYAARGGKKSKGYKYSGSDDIDKVAWYDDNSEGKSHIVGQKKANELGLYDMSGNVYEWCSDGWPSSYTSEAQTNPQGREGGTFRVCRGGSWCNYARGCRVSYRDCYEHGDGLRYVGFRLARSL